MRGQGSSPSDWVAALGFALLALGTYLPWMTQTGGTLEQRVPGQVAGRHPARVVLLVPLIAVFTFRVIDWLPRIRLLVLASTGVASVLFPPIRILQAAHASGVDFVPAVGYFLTTVSGLVLAVAATLAWTERRLGADQSFPAEPDDHRFTE